MPAVDLPYDKVEALIHQISIGGKIIRLKNRSSKEESLLLLHPTALDKLLADLEYKEAYDTAIKEGFLTIEETSAITRKKGIFTVEDEVNAAKLENQIAAQEKLLEMTMRVPANRERIKKTISDLRAKLMAILQKKDVGMEYCAERKAQEQRYLFLSWKGTRNIHTNELFWPTREIFENETDVLFRRNVLIEYIRLSSGTESSILRYLARHNLWRIRYIISTKTKAPLFPRDLADYSVDQQALAYWSFFYQQVYEMSPADRPPDGVIEDDAALDAYMKSYSEEANREANAAREKKRSSRGGKKTAWDHGETLVMRSNPIYSEVEYSDTVEAIRNKQVTDLKVKNNRPHTK